MCRDTVDEAGGSPTRRVLRRVSQSLHKQSHFYFIRLRPRRSREKVTEYGKVTSPRSLLTRQYIS